MAIREKPPKRSSTARDLAVAFFRSLASLRLAVILLVALAAILAWATLLEADKGREYAQWYVYGSQWFIALLALLAVNISAATLIRFPWKSRQIGFLITHVGLLILLAGSIYTFVQGVEGQLTFAEGDTESKVLLAHRSEIKVLGHGPDGRRSTTYSFNPGPVDWGEDKTLDFGQSGDVGIHVLRYYRHARNKVDWVADEQKLGGAAIRFAFSGSDGAAVAENWLVAGPSGGETFVGPVRLQLLPASSNSMIKDFLEPPATEPGTAGVLSMHYKDQMVRIPVRPNIGKKVPVGESGIEVEIAEYLANAKPTGRGRFVSQGEEPKRPLLELRVHLPDGEKPLRQIAFARSPLLNLDGVHGLQCPVKFWYHHPAVSPAPGTDFFQTPNGKLYCRVSAEGKYKNLGEVTVGDPIEVAAGFKVSVMEHLPNACRKVTFYPVELAPDQTEGAEAAVLVEFTVGDATGQAWLQRNHEEFGYHRVQTSQGPVILTFGYEYLPLSFSLKLLDFERRLNPGGMGDAAFASSVELIDKDLGVKEKREISMNVPLVHGKFRFYQSGLDRLPDGRDVSRLTVAYDPGRFLKYLGSLMICLGTFVMFTMRTGSWKRILTFGLRSSRAGKVDPLLGNGHDLAPELHPGDETQRHAKANRIGVP